MIKTSILRLDISLNTGTPHACACYRQQRASDRAVDEQRLSLAQHRHAEKCRPPVPYVHYYSFHMYTARR